MSRAPHGGTTCGNMKHYFQRHSRYAILAIAAVFGSLLTACNGGGSSVLGPISNLGPGGNNAQVRFVNGSPDAGPVQVFIDNQQQFCSGTTAASSCTISYGQTTSYAVNLSAGNHAIVLKDASGTQISIPSGTLALNSGFRYSVVLAGEVHPSYAGSPTLQIVTMTEQPFNTPGGGAAVNAHYAAPYVQQTNPGPLQFGFSTAAAASGTPLGQTVSFGAETTPQGLPGSALNTPITFYAISTASGITGTPGQFSTQCSSNALPCDTGNLSLYLIDGPAASSAPVAGPYPAGVTSSTKAFFTGAFDKNG